MIDNDIYNERELLLRIADGDEKAFTALVVNTSGVLHSFIMRHLDSREMAEEIVQDVFTQIWETRESLPVIRNFRTYLYVLSKNRAFNEIKKAIRIRKRQKEWERAAQYEDPEKQFQETERVYNIVEDVIAQLPPQQKRVWLLSRRDGRTYPEIAAEMNISRETVKTYLQHANKSIAELLSAHPDMLLLLLLIEIL